MERIYFNFYLDDFGQNFDGPFTLEEALKNKEFYDSHCDKSCILKLYIDFDGEKI